MYRHAVRGHSSMETCVRRCGLGFPFDWDFEVLTLERRGTGRCTWEVGRARTQERVWGAFNHGGDEKPGSRVSRERVRARSAVRQIERSDMWWNVRWGWEGERQRRGIQVCDFVSWKRGIGDVLVLGGKSYDVLETFRKVVLLGVAVWRKDITLRRRVSMLSCHHAINHQPSPFPRPWYDGIWSGHLLDRFRS
jgi:hypothetical protein